jgi:hypothetical protein
MDAVQFTVLGRTPESAQGPREITGSLIELVPLQVLPDG